MANEILQSLGMLNSYLGQEVGRVRQERKEDLANMQAASIADTFLGLDKNATEQDVQQVTISAIKEAALANTLRENQPLIQNLFQSQMNMVANERALAKQRAFDSYVGDRYGKEAATMGGEAFLKLQDYEKSQISKPADRFEDASGKSYQIQHKWDAKTGKYIEVGRQVVSEDTYEAKSRRHIQDTAAQSRIQSDASIRQMIVGKQWDMNNKIDFWKGYESENGLPIIQKGNILYTQKVENGKVIMQPLTGGVNKIATNLSEQMAIDRKNKMFNTTYGPVLEGEAQALLSEIQASGYDTEEFFKDSGNTNDPKYVKEKLYTLLQTKGPEVLKKLKETYPDNNYNDAFNRLESFKANMTSWNANQANIVKENTVAGQNYGLDKKTIEILNKSNIPISLYREDFQKLKTDFDNPKTSSAVKNALKNSPLTRDYFKDKAIEAITVDDLNLMPTEVKIKFFNKTR